MKFEPSQFSNIGWRFNLNPPSKILQNILFWRSFESSFTVDSENSLSDNMTGIALSPAEGEKPSPLVDIRKLGALKVWNSDSFGIEPNIVLSTLFFWFAYNL